MKRAKSTGITTRTTVIISLILILTIAVLYVQFSHKTGASEGSACRFDGECVTGLCAMGICSSGKIGSPCAKSEDCFSRFCVEFACTRGDVGDPCRNPKNCQQGLLCANWTCSAGTRGSPCLTGDDCLTAFCARNICTDGKEGDACETYAQCNEGLLCKNSTCMKPESPPAWAEYFGQIELMKFNSSAAIGPDNMPVTATLFASGEGIMCRANANLGVGGKSYINVINAVTGERIFTTPEFEMFAEKNIVFPLPRDPGRYEMTFYFINESMRMIPFEVEG